MLVTKYSLTIEFRNSCISREFEGDRFDMEWLFQFLSMSTVKGRITLFDKRGYVIEMLSR